MEIYKHMKKLKVIQGVLLDQRKKILLRQKRKN